MPQIHATAEPIESRLNRRPWFFVWTVMAIIAMTASRAEATCGDYLSHSAMVDHNAVSIPGDLRPMKEPLSRMPCHGPSCQKAPSHLPASTPVVSLETQDRWGWMALIVIAPVEQTNRLSRTNDLVSFPMIAFRLDRPPKA